MSYLFVRPPVNTSHFASGDQPCRCDGVLDVICLGVPPATGSVKMRDCPPWLALWSLMPSIFPSKDKTWSLLLRLFGSVLSSDGFLVARSKRFNFPQPSARPLTLKINALPSAVQFGASNGSVEE